MLGVTLWGVAGLLGVVRDGHGVLFEGLAVGSIDDTIEIVMDGDTAFVADKRLMDATVGTCGTAGIAGTAAASANYDGADDDKDTAKKECNKGSACLPSVALLLGSAEAVDGASGGASGRVAVDAL